jgi:hypothetical protein
VNVTIGSPSPAGHPIGLNLATLGTPAVRSPVESWRCPEPNGIDIGTAIHPYREASVKDRGEGHRVESQH